jgi:hypothetical protein
VTTAALVTVLVAALAVDCTSADERPSRPGAASLEVRTAQRISATTVASDTLTDSAVVIGVFPEADGDAVPFTFADPARAISAGLAIARRDSAPPALLWPDSVTAVWWSGPHALAFTTASGRGVHAVVDVHSANATVTDDTVQRPPRPVGAPARDDPTFVRAVKYVDSVHVQPAGQPQGSSLRYEVTSLRVAPDGRLGAFYVIAADSAGRRSNPTWYALDVQTGAVRVIDEIVGPATEMPESAAGWTADGRFLYAKRATIWEAAVRSAAA